MWIREQSTKALLRATIAEKHGLRDFELLDATWDALVEDRLPEEYMNATDAAQREGHLDDMVELVERWYRAAGREIGSPREAAPEMISTHESEAGMKNQRLHQEAVSALLAQWANQDKRVKGFRDEALGGNLLSVNQVGTWIKEQAERDGGAKGWCGSGISSPRHGKRWTRRAAPQAILAGLEANPNPPQGAGNLPPYNVTESDAPRRGLLARVKRAPGN